MIVETKFNKGESVYIILGKTLTKKSIRSLQITNEYSELLIKYFFYSDEGANFSFDEKDVFGSKEEAAVAWLESQGLNTGLVES